MLFGPASLDEGRGEFLLFLLVYFLLGRLPSGRKGHAIPPGSPAADRTQGHLVVGFVALDAYAVVADGATGGQGSPGPAKGSMMTPWPIGKAEPADAAHECLGLEAGVGRYSAFARAGVRPLRDDIGEGQAVFAHGADRRWRGW